MFWGESVQFNQKFVPQKEDYAYLHLRNASTLWANEKISLVCNFKKQENGIEQEHSIVLCHLDENLNRSAQLNLYFDLTNQDISFSVVGKGKVCLMGSLEAKEGKALTNELVKNLRPQIADAKKKMILGLAGLVNEMKAKGGNQDEDEDLDDEEEYVEGMDLESNDDIDSQEEDEEDDDYDDEEEDLQQQQQIVQQKKPESIKNQQKNINNQNKQVNNQKVNKSSNQEETVSSENQQQKQNKQAEKKGQQAINAQNKKQNGKKSEFHVSYNFKPKNEEEIEKDEFAAI